MRRREFIALLGAAVATGANSARGQQSRTAVIGFLGAGSPPAYSPFVDACLQGLGEQGYVERRNVSIEYRWADNHYDRLPALAAELVRRQVDAIAVSGGTPPAIAAKAATTTIPIVFTTGYDPIAAGLVATLNKPGGNLTGVITLTAELAPKRLELLHQLVPPATVIGVLFNPTNPYVLAQLQSLEAAARTLGLQLHVLYASGESDLDAAFANLVQLRADALLIGSESFFTSQSEHLAARANRQAVPAMYQSRAFVAAGGLVSYGGTSRDVYRLVGVYTGRVLKGEKPADLPVQQVTKVELLINLRTAKALGVTIPASLLARADEVIE